MKKIIPFFYAIITVVLFTSCNSLDKDESSTTTTTIISKDTAPYMMICDGVLHETGNRIILYQGPESLYDEKTILDGYVSIGDIVKKVSSSTSPTEEMHANFLKEGTTIYYNEEKNAFAYKIFYEEISELRVFEHTCDKKCKKVAD